jgi:PncC family amidohydrolase
MAEAIRDQTGASIGLATTGIAGPDGGTEAKPVGTVYIAIATESGTHTERLQLSGQRDQIQSRAAVAVLHRMVTFK